MNQTQNLADLIKAFRQRSNMTQTEFARASGYYQAQVSQLETGHLFDLRASGVVSLARLLGLEVGVVWNALLNSILIGSAPGGGESPGIALPHLRTDGGRGAIDGRGKRKPKQLATVTIPNEGLGQRGIVGADGHVRVVNTPDPLSAAESEAEKAFQIRGVGASESLGDKPAAFQFKGVKAVPIPLDDIPYDDGLEETGDLDAEHARAFVPEPLPIDAASQTGKRLTATDFVDTGRNPDSAPQSGNGVLPST